MNCIYCGDRVARHSDAMHACTYCVAVARKMSLNAVQRERFGDDDEFTWNGVKWFKWRGRWRVA